MSVSMFHTDKYGWTRLHWAATRLSRSQILTALQDLDVNVFTGPENWEEGETALAVICSNDNAIRFVDEEDPYEYLWTQERDEKRDEERVIATIDLLLEHGADINLAKYGWTPMHQAVKYCKLNIVRHLLKRGANPDGAPTYTDERTPLHVALDHFSSLEMIKTLVEAGANPNIHQGGATSLADSLQEAIDIAEEVSPHRQYLIETVLPYVQSL